MPSHVRALAVSGVFVVIAAVAGYAQAPSPPSGLNSSVTGNSVTIFWNPVAGAVDYVVQVGSAPGASNLFSGAVGNTTTASGTIGPGTYFWRVLAIGPSGAASAPSAEDQFVVGGGGGGGGCVPPGAPQNFTFTVAGLSLTLRWSPPTSGGPPTSYIIEAGSGPGLANLFNGPTSATPTELTVGAPPGQYFVRLRSQNNCGTSGVSNEQLIVVGGTNGGTCSYAVSPSSVNVASGGGTLQVNVTAPSQCRWQLQSDSFIVPTSATSGSGSATVQYMVAGSSVSRNGQINLVGLDQGPVTASQVLVQQSSSPPSSCAVSLNPSSRDVNPGGGQFQFRVTANPGCAWNVAPAGGFISIVSAGLQAGSDNVIYAVSPNTAAGARSGLVRVTSSAGSQDHAITQQGVGQLTASFVMRENSQVVTSCQVIQGGQCSLDASASTPQSQITSYDWTILRAGAPFPKPASVVNPVLQLDCNSETPNNSIETFEVTLIVSNNAGQTATLTRMLALHRAGCGT